VVDGLVNLHRLLHPRQREVSSNSKTGPPNSIALIVFGGLIALVVLFRQLLPAATGGFFFFFFSPQKNPPRSGGAQAGLYFYTPPQNLLRGLLPLDFSVAPGALAVLGGDHAGAFPLLSVSILMPIVAGLLIRHPDPGDADRFRGTPWASPCSPSWSPYGAYLQRLRPLRGPAWQLIERLEWLPDSAWAWVRSCRRALDAPDSFFFALFPTPAFFSSPPWRCCAAWPVTFKTALFFFLILAMDARPRSPVFASGHASVLPWPGKAGRNLLPVLTCCGILGGKKRQYAATKVILLHRRRLGVHPCWRPWPMGFQGGRPPSFEYTALAGQGFRTPLSCWAYAGL